MIRFETGRRTLGGAAACLVVLAGCGTPQAPPAPAAERELVVPTPPEPPTDEADPKPDRKPVPRLRPPAEVVPVPKGEPVRVVIPAIDVDATLVELGLEPDGAMEVPDFGSAGWYAPGPAPGHPGPAVIAAHVDSRAGPDVFYRLRDLDPGDEVLVAYDTGDEVTFLVEASERIPKDDLPGDRIWPVTADRLLTLITCGGDFDRSVRHYRDNIIVYTVPAPP